ncbi:MAG TPA: multicopper oxidase domain-containing protein, partial [Geobacteraceae bacterium]
WDPTGASGLSFVNGPGGVLDNIPAQPCLPGQADYFYPNDQSTRLMWYHDHAHGITRINAYAGVATGYLCVDLAQEQIISAGTWSRAVLGNTLDTTQDNVPFIGGAIPVVFQDKIFVNGAPSAVPGGLGTGTFATDPTWATIMPPKAQTPGSLWYAHIYDPKLYKLAQGKAFSPLPQVSCVPEFFGDTMLANGTVYPVVTVTPEPHRFLFLNACNARFVNLNLIQVPAPGMEVWTDPKTALPGGYVAPAVAPALPVPVPGPVTFGPALWQIGNEAGYLQTPYMAPNGITGYFNPALFSGNLILGCAERADVVIDFSGYAAGTEFVMYSDLPGPYPVGAPMNDYYWGNPKNLLGGLPGQGPDTRQILRIKVGGTASAIPAKTPSAAMLGTTAPNKVGPANPLVTYAAPLAGATTVPAIPSTAVAGATLKQFTLNEDFDIYGRLRQLVGTTVPSLGKGGAATFGLDYLAPPTAQDQHNINATEVWEIYNLSADTHPMHIHLSSAMILSRQTFKIVNGVFTKTGLPRGADLNEVGWKETFKMNPGEVITIAMRWIPPAVPFTVPSSPRIATIAAANPLLMTVPAPYNEYVWHCHILEHEEHDMMRPLIVGGPNPTIPFAVTPAAATATAMALTAQTFDFALTGAWLLPAIQVATDNASFTPVLKAGTASTYTVTVPAGTPALLTPVTFTFTATTATGVASLTAKLTIA